MSLLLLAALAVPLDHHESPDGFTPLFNGNDLDGWEGMDQYWTVEDGQIVGRTGGDRDELTFNTFLVSTADVPGDFELRATYNIEGGNSGIQYRSETFDDADKFRVRGYQADIDSSPKYTGMLYEERLRGIVAARGRIVHITADGEVNVVGSLGDPDVLQQRFVKSGDWNDYRIVARGRTMQHYVNGRLMSEVTDDSEKFRPDGIVALQIHQGPPMTLRFRDVRVKALK